DAAGGRDEGNQDTSRPPRDRVPGGHRQHRLPELRHLPAARPAGHRRFPRPRQERQEGTGHLFQGATKMNLARITLYVQHEGPLEQPRVHNDTPNLDLLPAATLTLPGCAVVGPILAEDHPQPMRWFSEAEIRAACARIE